MAEYSYVTVLVAEVTCEAPLDEPSYTHRRGRQIVWVTPAAATAAAPCRIYEETRIYAHFSKSHIKL